MNAKGQSMGKYFVILWVVVVVGTLGAMQMFMFDRSKGKPNPALAATAKFGPAAAGAADQPKPAEPAAPSAGPKMVQPESLEQGFIILVTDKARRANGSSPIVMPSSHNGWNPADPKMQLQAQSDQKWRIVWEKPTLDSRIAFKFARGSWENVETDKDFKDIENRMLPMVDVSKLAPGEKPVIELEIVAWKDASPSASGSSAADRYRSIKVGAGRLERVEVVGGGAGGGLSRDVLVWLPPGYDASENRSVKYPVLYMQDGQNLFDKHSTIAAEWAIDETAGKLIDEKKIEPVIIVGIPNAGAKRSQEYLPFAMIDGVTPRGKEYVSFVVNEVMPRIEREFRVKGGPENTAIGGSSLGAIIALEAAMERPDVFGKVLLESTPLTAKNRAGFTYFAQQKTWPKMVYFGMGGKETGTEAKDSGANAQYTASAEAFKELAAGKGLKDGQFKLVIDPDATHNEQAWAKRFGGAMEFLFPATK